MNTSVHLPDKLAKRLKDYQNYTRRSRNSILVESLEEYLDRVESNLQWSQEFLAWENLPQQPIAEGLELDRELWREVDFD